MSFTIPVSVTFILSPYHVGIRNHGVGAGPAYIQPLAEAALSDIGLPIHVVEIEQVDDFEGEIGRSFELMRRASVEVTRALRANSFPVVLAGDCGTSVGVAAGCNHPLHESGGSDKLGIVWFDAHDDYNIPDTVLSGYFDSQALAMMAGECWKGMVATIPGHETVALQENLIHVGMRDVNDVERSRVVTAGFDVVWGHRSDNVGRLTNLLAKKNLGPILLHIDVDCLDISLGKANPFASSGGLLELEMYECVDAILQHTRPLALTIAAFDPTNEGAENIARIAARVIKLVVEDPRKEGGSSNIAP